MNETNSPNTTNSDDRDEAQQLLVKKRKINPNDEHTLSFLLANDLSDITDYFILLFSQVTRGIMNESDLEKAKKKRPCDHLGFLGLQCRHCGGVERGKYFPSCSKNLQATPPTLHSHMMICPDVPEDIKRALKLTKTRHKFAAMTKPSGSQAAFFSNVWQRIQSLAFTGADSADLATIQTEIDFIVEQSKPKPKMDLLMQITRQRELTTRVLNPLDPAQVDLPNVVSYDMDNEYQQTYAAEALDVDLKTATSPPTEEDFELALDLLRKPETPDNNHYLQCPDMAFAMTPTTVSGILSPIPTRVNSFGERYHNGKFVISSKYDATNFCEETEEEASSPTPNEDGKTRKFTRSDEVLLIRGILKYGKSSWKKIWQETRELQHIKHSALKDRARSKRFCSILEQARRDPSLLNRPDELCGDEHSPAYHSPMASATPRGRNGSTPIGNNTPSADVLSAYGPLHRR